MWDKRLLICLTLSEAQIIEARKLVYLQKVIVMYYSPYCGQEIPACTYVAGVATRKNGVKFLNYSGFQEPAYSQDAIHLNDTGTREFSNEIASILNIRI